MKAICDECGKGFELEQDMLKFKKWGKGIIETYYKCPNCNTRYTIAKTNPKIRKLKREYDLTLNKLNEEANGRGINQELLKMAYQLKNDIKVEMDRLNGRG